MIEYIDPRSIYLNGPEKPLKEKERSVLRGLAEKVAAYARDSRMKENRELWYAHNSLQRVRPVVVVFPELAWLEILPWNSMVCEDEFYRSYEWQLRRQIYRYEHFRDDWVIEPCLEVPLAARFTPFMENGRTFIHYDMEDTGRGKDAECVLLDGDEDLGRLRKPEFIYRKDQTEINFTCIKDAIGDILDVKLYPYQVPDTSLLRQFIELRGAENILYDTIERPEWLHSVLGFMRDATLELLDEMEKTLSAANTGMDYVGSGGVGYLRELETGGKITYKNCWGHADAQELAAVSPAMYEEFATAYHEPLLERFGVSCYGCCEPMTDKFGIIKRRIKNLRRVSVNPWTDRRRAAKELEDRYIYSWKPAPTVVTSGWNPDEAAKDIEYTMEAAGGCVVEMILKDTITIEHDPGRLRDWIDLAQKTAQKGYR